MEILTKNMKMQKQMELMGKIDLRLRGKVKYLGITMTNINYMLYQIN